MSGHSCPHQDGECKGIGPASEPCPLCGATYTDVLSATLRRGTGHVRVCQTCDLGYLVGERPGVGHYRKAYRQQASHLATGGATSPQEIFAAYAPYQQRRLEMVTPHLVGRPRILEIGASAGQFLRQIQSPTRYAVEPDDACREFLAANAIQTAADLSAFRRHRFDVICAFQVLEHIEQPEVFLGDVDRMLTDGGRAFVEVPSLHDPLLSVWSVPEYRRFFCHADHLWYFSERSLRDFAARAGIGGVEVEYVQDYGLQNHLHWGLARAPQPDNSGLGRQTLPCGGEIGEWLNARMESLGLEYCRRLEESGQASNLMMTWRKE